MPAEALRISNAGGYQELLYGGSATSEPFLLPRRSGQGAFERAVEVTASFANLREMLYINSTSTLTFSQEEQDQVNQILELYDVRHRQDVESFLLERKTLVGAVLEAYSEIVQRFGANPHVTLLVEPGEYASEPPELWAEIETSLSVDDAYDKLQEITGSWYAANADQLLGYFNLDLEFA